VQSDHALGSPYTSVPGLCELNNIAAQNNTGAEQAQHQTAVYKHDPNPNPNL